MELALPKTFALKSHYNNKYLAYIPEHGKIQGLLKFSADEVSSLTTFEVEKAKSEDGLVHIRCAYNNKYWRRQTSTNHWIAAVADEPEEVKSKWSCTLFKPQLLVHDPAGAKTLQLRHVQLGHYACLWRAAEPHKFCLFAGTYTPHPHKQDIFTITDLVPQPELGPLSRREIIDVKFNLKDAKIYNQMTIEMATGIAINDHENTTEVKGVSLEYTKSGSSTWKSSSSSLNSDIMTDLDSAVPVIANENSTVLSGDQFTGSYQWGKTMESTYRVKTTYKVIVPPKTMMMVTLKATNASCDVPFSYTERDTFKSGAKKTLNKTDGIYTGVNLFNFRYETTQKKRR